MKSQKQKSGENIIEGGAMFLPQQTADLELWPCGSRFLFKDEKKRLLNLLPKPRKATGAKHMSKTFLYGGLGKPLCEVVSMKPELPWRPQVGENRFVGYLPRKAAIKEWQEKSIRFSQ